MGYRYIFLFLFISVFAAGVNAQNSSVIKLQQSSQILQDRGEIVLRFHVATKDQINNDLTRIMSIDNVKPAAAGGFDVIAYANAQEFQTFLTRNIPYEIIPKDAPKALTMATTVAQMATWDRYPTYSVYEQMMADFASTYPTLCDIDTILAPTPSGNYKILVARISDNVNTAENEPQFLYSSSMHGDETTGYYLMLRMINYLLSNYGSISQVSNLVNGAEIWICPLANPEGTYYLSSPVGSTIANSRRNNLSNVDLNRNYKDPLDGDHPDGNAWQPETQAFMTFADNHHFNMAGNFHGGAEVMNYPWDTWTTAGNPNADAAWWERVCTNYVTTARTVTAGYMTDTYSDGVTEGGDWYVITGGRQDYMNYFHQCREVTIELDDIKTTATENLNGMWNTNYQALMNYMTESLYGIRGIITDSCTGQPIRARVFANSYDQANDSSHVYSALPVGNYHKYVNTGTYSLTFSAPGYNSKTINNISVTNGTATVVNVALVQPAPEANYSANVTSTCNGNVQFTNSGTYASGSTFLWNFGDGQTSTLENPDHTYASNGTYTVQLTITACAGSDSEIKISYITVNMPAAPVATGATVCESGTATLTASGTNTLNWFSAATGGTLLGTGTTYTTPSISSTTTYYVENNIPATPTNVGPAVGGASRNVAAIEYFDVYEPMTLISVQAMAATAGSKTITLLDNTGATVYTSNVNVNTTTTTVTLNWLIQPGTGYQLLTPANSTLYRIYTGTAYPYTAAGLCAITGCDIGSDYFYSWFNWTVKGAGCSSARIPVTATVQTESTPTFTALGPYCVGGTPATLATTSTNSISGTWSPATISTASAGTNTYTFTPTAGQCATTANLNIVVTDNITPTFAAIGPYCVDATPATLPLSSTNGIAGTWSPATISTASAGTTTYTFTPSAGQCATTASLEIVTNDFTIPSFTALGPYCEGDTPGILSTTSGNGITGTWSPAVISTATVGTSAYHFTPTAGQCASNTSMNIDVTEGVEPTFTQLGPYCVGATPGSMPSTSVNGISGTWSPATISTVSAGTNTYTFTPNAGQCGTIATMSVETGTNINATFNSFGPYCVGATPSVLPTNSINGITGVWSPATISTASEGTTTYTFTPDGGQCAGIYTTDITVATEITPLFAAVGPYCVDASPATLPLLSTNGITGTWSPATISTASAGTTIYTFTPTGGQCAIAVNMSISVNDNITPTFTTPGPYCVGATPATLATTSGNGVNGSWSPSSISTASGGTTTYYFTPTAGQCATNTNISIEVDENIVPAFTMTNFYCVGATPASLSPTSTTGITGTWSPSTISTASTGTTSYTFTPNAGQCAESYSTNIVVDNSINATFNTFGPYCTGETPATLPTISNNGITGTWSPSSINTAIVGTVTYTFTPDAGQCAGSFTMNVTITSGTTPPFSILGPYCLGSTPGTLPTTALNGVSGSWNPAIINTSVVGTTIYTFTPNPGQCATNATLSITVNPEYSFSESHSICSGNSYTWHGNTYSASGTYTVNHPSIHGCDSTYTLYLTINPEFSYTENHTICPGSSYTWHGNTYSSAGTYYDNYTSALGCDSVYALNLSIGQEYAFAENHSICAGESYMWHGAAYSTAGTYTKPYSTIHGCDSTYTLNLSVNQLPVVSLGNDTTICADEETITLDAGNTGATYIWSENGATTQSIQFTCTGCNPGVYPIWVAVDNGCTASDTININIQLCDIIDESGNILLSLYPNPTEGLVYLSTNGMYNDVQITLTHADGRIIYQGLLQNLSGSAELKEFDLSQYAAGFYFLHISSDVHSKTIKIVRD